MEDLITLIIAIVVGLLSLFSGRKRTTPTPQQRPQTTPQDTEYEWETAEEARSDWEQPTPKERPNRQENRLENKELSPMDVIGKILTGDIEDLLQTKKPSVPRVENEYIDPVKSHPAKPLQSHFEVEKSKQAPGATINLEEPGRSLYPDLSDPAALRQAIVVREILDRPISKRNRHRSVA
jgi:hypothetical protein